VKIAILQLNVSDDPAANLLDTRRMVEEAVAQGAELIATPEVTNCVSTNREHQRSVLHLEQDDPGHALWSYRNDDLLRRPVSRALSGVG